MLPSGNFKDSDGFAMSLLTRLLPDFAKGIRYWRRQFRDMAARHALEKHEIDRYAIEMQGRIEQGEKLDS